MTSTHSSSTETKPRAPLATRKAAPKLQTAATAGPHGATVTRSPKDRVIRVVCVDDHAMLIEGLRAQFSIDQAIEIVGQLDSATGMIDACKRLRPDAVLLDIEMPGPDVFEMTERLKLACPEVRVMILSAHVRDGYISAAFNAGACAYFAKSDQVEDIVHGVLRMVAEEQSGFLLGPRVLERCRAPTLGRSATASRRSIQRPRGSPNDEAAALTPIGPLTMLASLTGRESEVLRLIGSGLSRTQIAAQLCRSVKTIDGHQDRMMRKLAIRSRADLMRFAIREGLALA